MRCTCVKEHLSTLVDNEASLLMQFRLRRHLAHCQSCVVELAELQRIDQQVREWRAVDAPAALRERLMSSLPQPVELTHNLFQPRLINVRHFIVRWRFAGVLGSVLVLHWLVIGRLDAQRAELLMLPVSNATYLADRSSESERQPNPFLWRSQTLALLHEDNGMNDFVTPKGTNHDSTPATSPARTPAGAKSG